MLRRWWRKKEPAKTRDMMSIVTRETITLEHKTSGKTYSFSIGSSDDGRWWSITDTAQNPKFCFESEDRDVAYQKGVDALNFYFENHMEL